MRQLSLFLVMIICISPCVADSYPDRAGIYLQRADKSEVAIGTITFTRTEKNATAFAVDLDNSAFSEHFLSMRPFRCLQDSKEWFCYLPYPYDLKNLVTADDLSDLEYSLLFILKSPAEFGIDAWNGLYYKLTLQPDQTLTGKLYEGDLNSLQSPPTDKYGKMINLDEFIKASKKQRLFPLLRIY